MSEYEALRQLGHHDLGAVAEIGFGASLWSIQRKIMRALSVPRAKVIVPSSHASGKTYLAGAALLAFYWTFNESKLVATSSTDTQLRAALWSEVRSHYANARIPIQGNLLPGDMALRDGSKHFMLGLSPSKPEALQGLHSPHKLIVVDEGAAVGHEMATGLTALLSSGDSRMLVILNPTDDSTWAASLVNNPDWVCIPIQAWDTPHFTGEPAPPGSSLITPRFLEDLKNDGRGPGTYFWETRVEARFWSQAQTQLISGTWWEMACHTNPERPGQRIMGVDLAPYGDAENAIAFREGNVLTKLEAHPAMRPDIFWSAVVRARVEEFKPAILVYDADGVGAGSFGDAKKAVEGTSTILLPFRGATTVDLAYLNIRSLWWWRMRERFEMGDIVIRVPDPKLKSQLTSIQYGFPGGKIKIESKEDMKKRGKESPDRGDAFMYAFSIDPPEPQKEIPAPGSDADVWARTEKTIKDREKNRRNPVGFNGRRIW